jgi:hypothetical protein
MEVLLSGTDYGRTSRIFPEKNINVTGIEISEKPSTWPGK